MSEIAVKRNANFSAGPAALPEEVLVQINHELFNWRDTGASVMEVSHRSDEFISMAEEMESDLRELLLIPENYKVLFLQGGGAMQFAQIPMNLLGDGAIVDYVDTGYWATKALQAAKQFAQVNVVAQVIERADGKLVPPEKTWQIFRLSCLSSLHCK
ncbi:Phosphoserine aminotransferase [Oligella ureolytica]